MAKITFLSLVFPPDSVSTAQIMGELAIELKRLGHEINVLTTTPHYNLDSEAENRQPLKNLAGNLFFRSEFDGIPVYHVRMPRKGPKILIRIIAWLNFHILNFLASFFVLNKPDLLIVPSPPLTMGINAWLLANFHGAKFIYNVQEIYPDYAINIKAIKNKYLIRILYGIEAFVYKKADALTVIASNMAEQLIRKHVPKKKLSIIPNFADIDELSPLPKDNPFSRKYELYEKFVVSYAGNMGEGQDLDTFIECAHLLKNQDGIHFLMMGDGTLRNKLKDKVQKLDLNNFTFLEYQPYSLIPRIYAASDLNLVPQSKTIINAAIPSKVYRIMACARTVLASTTPDSDLAHLINEANCGFIAESGSAKSLADVIMKSEMNHNLLNVMGEAGRKYVVKNFSRQAVAKQYHDLIISILTN